MPKQENQSEQTPEATVTQTTSNQVNDSQLTQANPADVVAAMQAQLAELQEQVRVLSTSAPAVPPQPASPSAPTEDGVYVKQWRPVDIEGDVVKKDVVENQYYDATTFAKLNEVVPGDEAKRTHFETLGIQYEITKDLRKSKKKA